MKLSKPAITSATLVALLTSVANAAVNKTCVNYTIPLTTNTTNQIWANPWKDNYGLVDFVSNLSVGIPQPYPWTGKTSQSTKTYNIAAEFCQPANVDYYHPKAGIVLMLSPGLNFDRSYWNPSFQPEKYSFADYFISLGYSVFLYDRLGTGLSTKLSGFENQASIQIAILDELTRAVKAGNYTSTIGKPKSLVHVGHSLGSDLVAAVVTASPDLVDGIILTGFTFNNPNGLGFLQAFAPRIAKTVDVKWTALDEGYFASSDIYADIEAFSKAPDYDVAVAQYTFENRQPIGINELLSRGFFPNYPKNFTGAAMVIAGQRDFIYCSGNCDGGAAPVDYNYTIALPQAKRCDPVSYPGAGHGLNFALNAQGAFRKIADCLTTHGL